LARRGWQVTVVDAAAKPASGASGLPVGLFAPYVSADNNFTSQICAVGVQFTQRLASRLLVEGLDWQPSGVMSRKYGEAERWHADAGWIKPAALVKACLAQANVTWRGHCDVKRLSRDGDSWMLIDKDEHILARADMVVIATANQSTELLNTMSAAPKLIFQAVRGQVTYGNLSAPATAETSTYPINGSGSYIATDAEWLVGATYDRNNLSLDASIRDQVDNFERLENLAPEIAAQLKPAFERGLVNNWVGIRCATTDRLPIVGEVLQGLWLCTAMASRGLTFAPLCAELLAAQCENDKSEELPLTPRLVKALSIQRYMKK
jgi:tRNA 5-methylaminomethyl-2-thiouridine biosynthesis bifunctional protein